MALHIIDEPTFGGRLGAAVGGGISGLLDNLVKQKAEQVQQARQEEQNRNINKILGLGLSQAPLQNYQSPIAEFEGPQQLQSMASQIQMPHEQQQAALQQATSALQNPAFRKLQEQQQGAQLLQQQQLAKPQAVQQIPAAAQPMIQQPQREPTIKDQLQDVRRRKQALGSLNLPLKEVKDLHTALQKEENALMKQSTEERKINAEEQKEINAETLPVYTKINDAGKAAKQASARLKRMEHLLDKGKVQTGVFQRALRSATHIPYLGPVFGILNNALTNRDTEEYDKLSSEFVKDAKPFFGNRMTQQEVEFYLKTVPNLLQTAGGQKRVIRNMQIFNEAAEVQQKAMREIIKENGGKRPRDLEEQIDDRTRNKLDALHQEFIGGPTGINA